MAKENTKEYHPASPYFNTDYYGRYLDVLTYRQITKRADDVVYQIEKAYAYRPQTLAYHLYGDTRLWWVFAARNPDLIKDPIFDFVDGLYIYVPYKQTLIEDLGL